MSDRSDSEVLDWILWDLAEDAGSMYQHLQSQSEIEEDTVFTEEFFVGIISKAALVFQYCDDVGMDARERVDEYAEENNLPQINWDWYESEVYDKAVGQDGEN